MKRYVRAIRERTTGNVYNYEYWRCPDCNYHPGGSDGPPAETCLNCGTALYTDDPELATGAIEVVTRNGRCTFCFVSTT